MHFSTLAAFVALELVLCLVPGPAVLAVVGAAFGHPRSGFATAFGILTGNLVYFAACAFGIASILFASHAAFVVCKWCGAGYLGYLGLRALTGEIVSPDVMPAKPKPLGQAWLAGTLTQLANPKALIFFAAILPQFIDPRVRLGGQLALLCIASLGVETVVLWLYVALASKTSQKHRALPRVWAERFGGACLVGVAAAVLFEGS